MAASWLLGRAIARQFSSAAKSGSFSPIETHAPGGHKLWKNLSLFVCIPAIGLCMLNAYLKHQEEHGHPRPEFIPWEHMRNRQKRFPWGDGQRSLFHNPHVNPLPDGYEDEH